MGRALLFGFGFILLAVSCSEEVKPTAYTYTQIFTGKTSKTWRLDKLMLRQKGKTDQAYSLASCERDDRYIFYANDERLFEVENGNIKCSGDDVDPLLVSYTWEFNNANASLSMVVPHIFGYFFIPFIVKSASSDSMELEIFINEEATVSYVLIFVKISET